MSMDRNFLSISLDASSTENNSKLGKDERSRIRARFFLFGTVHLLALCPKCIPYRTVAKRGAIKRKRRPFILSPNHLLQRPPNSPTDYCLCQELEQRPFWSSSYSSACVLLPPSRSTSGMPQTHKPGTGRVPHTCEIGISALCSSSFPPGQSPNRVLRNRMAS